MEVGFQEFYKRLRAIFRREWKTIIIIGVFGSIFAAVLNMILRGIPIFQATQLLVIKGEQREISIMPTTQAQPYGTQTSEIDVILSKIKFPEFYEGLWDSSLAYEVLRGDIKGIKKFAPGKYDQNTGKGIVICPCSKKFEVVIYDGLSLRERLSQVIGKKLEDGNTNPFSTGIKFFTISYVSPDKRWANKASELVANWIINKHLEEKRQNLIRQKRALENLMDFYKKQIDLFADELKDIKKTLKYPEYDEEGIYKILVELTNQKNAIINLKQKLSDGKIDTFLILTGDNTLDELQKERIKNIVDYITLRAVLGDSHPEVKGVLKRITKIDGLMIKSIDERLSYLNSRVQFFRSILPVVIEERAKLLTTQRNLENAEDFYIVLGQNLNDVEVKLFSITPNIEIIGKPRISLYNQYTKTRNVLPLGFFAGILLGILFAILRDLTTEYVLDETYLPFDKDTVISLPKFSEEDALPINMVLERFLDVNSPALNEFRKIAFKLNVFDDLKELIIVTSTQSGEGKTFVSANLAATLSISGIPTLLVDGDVRARSLSDFLGYLGKGGYADDNFNPYSISDNLLFLPVGKSEVDILAAFRKLIKHLEDFTGKYLIVIDMPPVGVSPEMKLLEKFASKHILVTRYNYTLRDSFKGLEIEPSVVIFNFAGERSRYYSKYYSKYQGRKPKKKLINRFLGFFKRDRK